MLNSKSTYAVGYPKFDREFVGAHGVMNDWQGNRIGWCRITAMWKVRSWVGSTMMQIECTINGRTYTGRGFGNGMVWRGRAKSGR